MIDFSKLLNPEQYAAATAPDGPLLALAAAGTGKTRTLVHRVAYLIERGVPAERIMLLTFTNRAAREMIDRVHAVVGDAVYGMWAGTFHSICARLLRHYGPMLGYASNFQIIDEDDQKKIIGEIIKANIENPKDFPKKEIVLKMISEAANERLEVRTVAKRWELKISGFKPEEICLIAERYKWRKTEINAMDFDDLLVNGLRLLTDENTASIRAMLQEHFLYILVDEYQDTNGLQAEFTDILAAGHRNIMVVGDDFQCIYTWRGAQIENIMEFPKRWPGCRIVKLERNYRSLPGVLNVANVVMKDVTGPFEKTLRPNRVDSSGEKPWLYRVYDDSQQAGEIIRMIDELCNSQYRYADMAVLYRSHFQSIKIQMSLAKKRIPYRITSGVGVFEQIHTKDVLAYLRLIMNPSDELSFMRFICLFPGVGEKGAAKLWSRLGGTFNMRDEAQRQQLNDLFGVKAKAVFPPLRKAMEVIDEHFEENSVGEIIEDFCDLFYEQHLRSEWEASEAEDRMADIKELASQIAEHREGLEGFLNDVALMTNLDVKRNEPNQNCVTLSTVHQAKGLEWPVVFVPWLADGMFPSSKATEENRMDEERRLFYVAVTRAKDKLFMYSPQMRSNPDGGIFPVDRSIFVTEIPDYLVNNRMLAMPPPAYGGYGNRGGYNNGRGGYGNRGGYGGYGARRY